MKLIKCITFWFLIFSMLLMPVVSIGAAAEEFESRPSFADSDNFVTEDEFIDDMEDGLLDESLDESEEEIVEIVVPDEDTTDNVQVPENQDEQDSQDETDADIVQPEGYIANTDFLSALGLYRFGDRMYNDAVTRGEFACMIMDLLTGVNGSEFKSDSVFNDVASDAEYADSICFAQEHGLMNGVDSERFCPDSTITFIQALKTIINALGYSEMAVVQGGFPSGYVKLGQRLGFLKNAPKDYDSPLSFDLAAALLCLSAETELCEPISFTTDSVSYAKSTDRLLINVYHNIYSNRGIMTDNGRTAVNKKKFRPDESVIIGGRTLFGATNQMRELIGCNLIYYYCENSGGNTLLYTSVDSRWNEIIYLYPEQLIYDNPAFSKECVVANVGGKTKKLKIDIYANLLYNGIFDETFTKDSFNITEGIIILIDADGDADYELVSVNEYVDIVVGDHLPNDRIAALYTVPDYSSVVYRNCYTVIFEDSEGNEIAPSEVITGDILSVYRSKDEKLIRFVQSKISKTIHIDSIEESEHTLTLGDEDESFLLSANYINLMNESPSLYPYPQLGAIYDAYLNFENKVVMLKQVYGRKQYAYLMRMANATRGRGVEMLMHLETDDTVVVTTAKKISINGVEGCTADELWDNADLFVDGKLVPQLVSIVLNSSGELKSIETDNSPNDDVLVLDPNGDGVLDDSEMAKIEANKGKYSLMYNPGQFSLDFYRGPGLGGLKYSAIDFKAICGGVAVTEDTKIFFLSHNNLNLETDEPEEVKVISYADYAGGLLGNPVIKLYDTDITWAAGAAVVTEDIPLTWSLFVVDDVKWVTDAYGDVKQSVSGYFNNYGHFTYRESEAGVLEKAVLQRYPGSDGKLKQGDILMPAFNLNNEIANAVILYSPLRDNDPDYNFVDVYTSTTSNIKYTRMSAGAVLVLGRLCALQDGRFGVYTKRNPEYVPLTAYTMPADNDADSYWVHSVTKATTYFHYDCTDRELKKVTLHDIAGSSDFGVNGFSSGDGSYSVADFTNFDDDTKIFILRQSGLARIIYFITGMNH